jgi:hypothetical protein
VRRHVQIERTRHNSLFTVMKFLCPVYFQVQKINDPFPILGIFFCGLVPLYYRLVMTANVTCIWKG